jgi:hypothetical protein
LSTEIAYKTLTRYAFDAAVDKLKTLVIRHTKAQRIGGEAALSLPTLTAETEWLSFTPTEKMLYVGVKRVPLYIPTVQVYIHMVLEEVVGGGYGNSTLYLSIDTFVSFDYIPCFCPPPSLLFFLLLSSSLPLSPSLPP